MSPIALLITVVGIQFFLGLLWAGKTHAADSATATVVVTAQSGVSPEPTVRPTLTATSTSTATVRPTVTATVVTRRERRHRTRATTSSPRPAVATPTQTPRPAKQQSQKHHRHHRRPRPSPTPSPSPTPTPAINLQAEDSIAPVSCNGPERKNVRRPFLRSPYRGWTSIVSIFDHDLPNFSRDGVVVSATGARSQTDSLHTAADFPAYWNGDMRQYVYYDGHNGYDFNLSYQPVYAAAAGTIIYAGYEYASAPDRGYGKMIMVNHRNGYITLYGHFSRIQVHRGQRIHAGQRLGVSGNTGHSTGPHLHFTVFHNCTPTDPYGWTGQGPDPLGDYQGEASTYLWISPPAIINPMPDWPGLSQLDGPPFSRLLLFRLPPALKGTDSFSAALMSELERARRSLMRSGVSVKMDSMNGSLLITGRVAPTILYRLSAIASVASTDAATDARADLLTTLAAAASHTTHARLRFSRRQAGSGYLFQWQGRTVLAGQTRAGRRLGLVFPAVGRSRSRRYTFTDPVTGTYLVDYGKLSAIQRSKLTRDLVKSVHSRAVGRPTKIESPIGSLHRISRSTATKNSTKVAIGATIATLLVFIALCLVGWKWPLRRVSPPHPEPVDRL